MCIRQLAEGDVPAVAALERRSFEAEWSPTAFEKEISSNRLARYLVAELSEPSPTLAAFGGLWTMADQAHVVAVGVAPEHRRRGMGRLVVVALLELAQELGLTDATLECRVSNEGAQALYRDLGFYEVGRRIKYYRNSEDAVIMTTEMFDSEGFQARYQKAKREAIASWPGALPWTDGGS